MSKIYKITSPSSVILVLNQYSTCNLFKLLEEIQGIDGEQLMKTNEMMAIQEFKIEDDEDRKNFMQCK